jgi:hypothetical protein
MELVVVASNGSPAWLIFDPNALASLTEMLVPAGMTGGGGGAGAGAAAGATDAAAGAGDAEGAGDAAGAGAGVAVGAGAEAAAGAALSADGFDLHPAKATPSKSTAIDILVLMVVFPLI